ncbi:MAG: site-2 protease family protein, partial [Rectinema sp.]
MEFARNRFGRYIGKRFGGANTRPHRSLGDAMILNVLLGLLGLSLVVVVHELGHFFAARAAGVEVEAFSIGWGPKLFGFKRKTTEWRVSAL